MKVVIAKFLKGIIKDDELLHDGKKQIAFIGRSNVGKSSLINMLTNTKKLARASSYPGRTQEINIFLINDSLYFVDLPGYGFARTSGRGRDKIGDLIENYLFETSIPPSLVILLVDATVGMTERDESMLFELEQHAIPVIVVANKIDKLNQSEFYNSMLKLKNNSFRKSIIPFSVKQKKGLNALFEMIERYVEN
ncbi:MAG: YihA family ribosome biogenesis GTP-binding protein [Candidatus Pacebacteria bacterium]|nr:YihA family ribosome biogenesis GTP-binding protein [Candidatus Paceibacterota bacterium]